MTSYCIERQRAPGHAVVHKHACTCYDLGTLLGEGGIADLGEFDDSLLALHAIKHLHPDAIRCLDCCHEDLVLQPRIRPVSRMECAKP